MFAARDPQGAQAEAERALTISPNLADAHGALGVVLTFSGRPQEGLAALKTCIRLDPRAPSLVNRLVQIAVALYFSREYAAAVEAARQASRSFPDHSRPYSILAAALGQMGRTAEAKEALEKNIAIAPGAIDAFVRGAYCVYDPRTTPTCSKACARPGCRRSEQARLTGDAQRVSWRRARAIRGWRSQGATLVMVELQRERTRQLPIKC
jgi:tetratricopeptide (TPR) repeat protein